VSGWSSLLVVLDEPTACLDAPAEHALFRRYAEASRRGAARTGAVTVLVSHRFSMVRAADLVAVLEGGGMQGTTRRRRPYGAVRAAGRGQPLTLRCDVGA